MTEQPQDLFIDEIAIIEPTQNSLTVESSLDSDAWEHLAQTISLRIDDMCQNINPHELLDDSPPLIQLLQQTPYVKHLAIPDQLIEILTREEKGNFSITEPPGAKRRKIHHILFPHDTKQHPFSEEEYTSMMNRVTSVDRKDPQWATKILQGMEQLMYYFPNKKEDIQKLATQDICNAALEDIDRLFDDTDDESLTYQLHQRLSTSASARQFWNMSFANIERLQMFFPEKIRKLHNFKRLDHFLKNYCDSFRSGILPYYHLPEIARATWFLLLLQAEKLEVSEEGVTLVLPQEKPQQTMSPEPTDFV